MGKSTVTLLGAEAKFFYQGYALPWKYHRLTVMDKTDSSGTPVLVSSTSPQIL